MLEFFLGSERKDHLDLVGKFQGLELHLMSCQRALILFIWQMYRLTQDLMA